MVLVSFNSWRSQIHAYFWLPGLNIFLPLQETFFHSLNYLLGKILNQYLELFMFIWKKVCIQKGHCSQNHYHPKWIWLHLMQLQKKRKGPRLDLAVYFLIASNLTDWNHFNIRILLPSTGSSPKHLLGTITHLSLLASLKIC